MEIVYIITYEDLLKTVVLDENNHELNQILLNDALAINFLSTQLILHVSEDF